jgi:hypothetical protein
MADQNDLRRTIEALRQEVPMRPEWSSAVLHRIDALPHPVARALDSAPAARRAGWTFRPLAAIAAGLACAMIGGTFTLGMQRLASKRGAPRPTMEAQHDPHRGAPVRFVLVAPAASTVSIVGDFNRWSPTATPMRRTAAGLWSIDLPLSAGRHTYAFVVDGGLVPDPNALDSADDDFGVPSSVVLVSEHPRT